MTDATTSAMVSGEASTRPWPMNDAACSTTSSVAGTDPRKPVKGRSSFSPMPSDCAAAVRSSWLTFSCWLMKAVLHE